jgi:hypothetical protein
VSGEIGRLYSRELGKYVERLGIRGEIEVMVERERGVDRL